MQKAKKTDVLQREGLKQFVLFWGQFSCRQEMHKSCTSGFATSCPPGQRAIASTPINIDMHPFHMQDCVFPFLKGIWDWHAIRGRRNPLGPEYAVREPWRGPLQQDDGLLNSMPLTRITGSHTAACQELYTTEVPVPSFTSPKSARSTRQRSAEHVDQSNVPWSAQTQKEPNEMRDTKARLAAVPSASQQCNPNPMRQRGLIRWWRCFGKCPLAL